MNSTIASPEDRVLLLAPTERDAHVASRLLREARVCICIHQDVGSLIADIHAGAGVVVITDDLMRSADGLLALETHLDRQPDWSELPVIALTRAEVNSESFRTFRRLPGLVMLERPVRVRTLMSAINAALRARRRQYQISDQLEQIRASNIELQENALAKDEFLATLAHELRNPLSALASAARLLDHPDARPSVAARARGSIGRQIGHMTRMLDDLLDVARVTRSKLELKKQPALLGDIISAAVETAAPTVQSKQHRLQVLVPPEPVMLNVDPLRLAQVLSNLLTNAAKYTDAGGDIQLRATVTAAEVTIAVCDSGIGIAAASLTGIFEIFTQLAPALNRSEGGLGLGLALAKGLVELHGGRIDARSDGPGKGTEFIVRIPRGATPALPDQQLADGGSSVIQSARRILIADDNADALEALAALLELRGHSVFTAEDGPAALAVAEREELDVVILDIGMPKLNGYDVARRMRSQTRYDATVLIALTGWGQPADRLQAADAGFDHHLTKPVDLDALERLAGSSRD